MSVEVTLEAPESSGVVWFGHRGSRLRYGNRFQFDVAESCDEADQARWPRGPGPRRTGRGGAVGVITLEIVRQDRNTPGNFRVGIGFSSRQSFWGNYRWAWNNAWHSGSPPSSNVWVETLMYSLQPEELLWAGRSRTVNPGAAEGLFAEVANAAANEMEKAGRLTVATR
jgi:hypothetical protein